MLALTYPDGPRVQRCEYLVDKPALSLANETRLVSRAPFTDHHFDRDSRKSLSTPTRPNYSSNYSSDRRLSRDDFFRKTLDGNVEISSKDRRRKRTSRSIEIIGIENESKSDNDRLEIFPVDRCRYCRSNWCGNRSSFESNVLLKKTSRSSIPNRGRISRIPLPDKTTDNESRSSSQQRNASNDKSARERIPNDPLNYRYTNNYLCDLVDLPNPGDLRAPDDNTIGGLDYDRSRRKYERSTIEIESEISKRRRRRRRPRSSSPSSSSGDQLSRRPNVRATKERIFQFVLMFVLVILGCTRHCGPYRSKVNRTAFSVLAISSVVARGARCSPLNLINDPGIRSERSANLSHITGTSRKIQMYVKNRHLQILPDGTVNGSRSDKSDYTILQRMSVSRGQLRIQGVATCLYLCMDACGYLYGSKEYTEECLFNETLELHNYNTYSSIRWSTPRRTLYLGLTNRGQSKKVIAKGHTLGRLSTYARVLTKVVPSDRVLELQRRMSDEHHKVRHHHGGSQQIVCPPIKLPDRSNRDQLRCAKRKKGKKKKRRCRIGESQGPQCEVGESPQSKRSCEGAASDEACRREAMETPSKKRKTRIESSPNDYDLDEEIAEDEVDSPPPPRRTNNNNNNNNNNNKNNNNKGGSNRNNKNKGKKSQSSGKKLNQKKVQQGVGGGRKGRRQQGSKKKTTTRVTRTTVTVERRKRVSPPTTLPASWYPRISSSTPSYSSRVSDRGGVGGRDPLGRAFESIREDNDDRADLVPTTLATLAPSNPAAKFLTNATELLPEDLRPRSDDANVESPTVSVPEDNETEAVEEGVEPETSVTNSAELTAYPEDLEDVTDSTYDVDEEDEDEDNVQISGSMLDRFAM